MITDHLADRRKQILKIVQIEMKLEVKVKVKK